MLKKEINQNLPTQADVSKFEMLEKLLVSIYDEMKEFSKKKPDEILNKFKVKNINRVLEQIKEILKREPTNEFLDLLDEESLPSNSDCILIIGQFNASMKQFRSKYHGWTGIDYTWSTKENPKTFSSI
ncbi:MAG: hypothetical protein LBH22_08225 [Bacteroidales bacterium]|jgi:hypothetical protein|nr:hypothetical protein [Bacteroidales bacterium]